jgi:hypothetical protein
VEKQHHQPSPQQQQEVGVSQNLHLDSNEDSMGEEEEVDNRKPRATIKELFKGKNKTQGSATVEKDKAGEKPNISPDSPEYTNRNGNASVVSSN